MKKVFFLALEILQNAEHNQVVLDIGGITLFLLEG
jgi:hypothetical protein